MGGTRFPFKSRLPGESCVPCVAEDDSRSLPCTCASRARRVVKTFTELFPASDVFP